MGIKITIDQLESGYVVTRTDPSANPYLGDSALHRTAEATLTGAIGIAARALGYHGTIEFGTRTVEVPVVGMTVPGVGIPFDDEEPPLRAGTAIGDKL